MTTHNFFIIILMIIMNNNNNFFLFCHLSDIWLNEWMEISWLLTARRRRWQAMESNYTPKIFFLWKAIQFNYHRLCSVLHRCTLLLPVPPICVASFPVPSLIYLNKNYYVDDFGTNDITHLNYRHRTRNPRWLEFGEGVPLESILWWRRPGIHTVTMCNNKINKTLHEILPLLVRCGIAS